MSRGSPRAVSPNSHDPKKDRGFEPSSVLALLAGERPALVWACANGRREEEY